MPDLQPDLPTNALCVTCDEPLPALWAGATRYAGSFGGRNRWRHSRCADPEMKSDAELAADQRRAALRFEGECIERERIVSWLRDGGNFMSRGTHHDDQIECQVLHRVANDIERGTHYA